MRHLTQVSTVNKPIQLSACLHLNKGSSQDTMKDNRIKQVKGHMCLALMLLDTDPFPSNTREHEVLHALPIRISSCSNRWDIDCSSPVWVMDLLHLLCSGDFFPASDHSSHAWIDQYLTEDSKGTLRRHSEFSLHAAFPLRFSVLKILVLSASKFWSLPLGRGPVSLV